MKANEILNKHKLKRTSCREGIIDVVISSNQALSEIEIREQLVGNYDRTTFYRSFKTLEEHKIIHKIVVDNQLVKYELDNSLSSKKDHAHFYCTKCKNVQCIDTIEMPQAELSSEYKVTEIEIVLKGICPLCSVQEENN